ncbi:MAG: hypothetical protein WBD87_02760 [Candidatus Acidiferrales bacterium]
MTRDVKSRTKAHRLLIVALLISLLGLIVTQLMTKSLGIPGLPSRVVSLIIAALSCAVCLLIWQIKRSGKREVHATVPTSEAEKRSFVGNLTKTLGLVAIFEAFIFGIISLGFRLPLRALLLPYLLFFMPAFVGLPLILHARQFFDRPKACAIRSALGVAVFCSLVAVAGFYSGLYGWLDPNPWTGWDVLAVTLFAAAVVFASTYYWMYARLTSAGSR